ncbi:MAG: helix-turn-helix transcriptional regulator [Pleurocapsa minor GSE-CHR-MK-17-07R]|nr:helix-turn-helix transcriptional regulator [Pleurocapsa minor GSE-CHR-MK 17-07R]
MLSDRVLATWENCPIETTLAILGGKWKPVILYHLFDHTRRFGELQRLIPQVTREMLTQHLRELEADGIVQRKIYHQVPPKVEYSLSPLGQTLKPMLVMMHEWAVTFRSENAPAPE